MSTNPPGASKFLAGGEAARDRGYNMQSIGVRAISQWHGTQTKKILSPYPDDRSAVTDCRKLASSGFGERRAIMIYGFEDPTRPIMWLIEAFELIAARTVTLGPRETAPLKDLVHPVFATGHVWGWEVLDSRSDSNVPTHQGAAMASCRVRPGATLEATRTKDFPIRRTSVDSRQERTRDHRLI